MRCLVTSGARSHHNSDIGPAANPLQSARVQVRIKLVIDNQPGI